MQSNFFDTEYLKFNTALSIESESLLMLENARQKIKQRNSLICKDVDTDLVYSKLFQKNREEASCFGYSLRSFLLYAQIGNSERRMPGLFIQIDDATFALGLYVRDYKVAAHIISPHGPNWFQHVTEFSRWLLQDKLADLVYVRQLKISDAIKLESYGFNKLDFSNAWCKNAPCEDETFNSRIINLKKTIKYSEDRVLYVNALDGEDSKNFRNKFRMSHRRAQNFLNRNNMSYTLRPFSGHDLLEVKRLVNNHFDILEQSGKAVGSCALDYELLLENTLANDERYVSLVGVLSTDKSELITSIFLAERTGLDAGGLYCSITDRNPLNLIKIKSDLDLTGFTALPQFALASLFSELIDRRWDYIDIGGSETHDLDRFKRQMGSSLYETTWRVLI